MESAAGIITINRLPVHALSDLQRNLQHYYDMCALGLNLADTVSNAQLELPGTTLNVKLTQNMPKSPDDVRAELHNWILRTGMRDSVEVVNGFLIDLRQQCATAALIAKTGGSVTWEEFHKTYEAETQKFEKLGLPKKIRDDKSALKECYGVVAEDKFIDAVISLNDARNCLVHRGGRVQKVDVNEPTSQKLVIKWFGPDVHAHSERGSREVEFGKTRTEADEVLEMNLLGERQKEFGLGEPILLTTQEFSEICLTFFFFGLETTKSAERFFRALGFLQPAEADVSSSS